MAAKMPDVTTRPLENDLEWYHAPEESEDKKRRFEETFGWRYGLFFAFVVFLVCWGQDGWGLSASFAEWSWAKPFMAAVTVLPLLTLAGWLSGRAYARDPIKIIIWMVAGGLSGFIAAHLPYEGLSGFAALFDPAARGVTVFPFVSSAAFMVGIAIVVGVVIAIPTALVQVLATQWAWDRSSEQGQVTLIGNLLLLLALPLAVLLALFWDGAANYSLRTPVERSNLVFQTALTTPSDLNIAKMSSEEMMTYVAGMPWRGKISSNYTQHIAYYDPDTMQQAVVDTAFNNGLILRCQLIQIGRFMGGCYDIGSEASTLVSQFVETGKAPCADCTVQIADGVTAWRGKLRQPATFSNIKAVHHSAGILLVQGQFSSGGEILCRLIGTDPVILHDCSGP